jgi:hypothetical protein
MRNRKAVKGIVKFEYENEILETYFYSGANENGISKVERTTKIKQFVSKKTKHPKYVIFSPILN